MINSSGKINKFPEKFNELDQRVKSLEDNNNVCNCGHPKRHHAMLKRFDDGSPIPQDPSCGIGGCSCKKFEPETDQLKNV